MSIAESITQRGFRRWYERELMRGHAHLVLLLLCAVAAMGAVEAFGQQQGQQRLLMVASLVLAAVLGTWAVRRYLFHLGLAEAMANQADCPQCQVYARWQVEAPVPGGLQVRCRACGGGWLVRC